MTEDEKSRPGQGGPNILTADSTAVSALDASAPADLNKEWTTAGVDLDACRRVLARMDSDAEYRREIGRQWAAGLEDGHEDDSEEEQERDVRQWIGCRIQVIEEVWPILLPAVLATMTGRLVDPDPELEMDTGARFRCPCGRSMARVGFGLSNKDDRDFFRNVNFYHINDSFCQLQLDGGDGPIIQYLGLANLYAYSEDGGMDLSFLDDESPEIPEPKWLIPGMFARGDYWSLFGPSEVGKSLLALDWALRMARNGERVLYLDKENPKHVLVARFKKMGATRADFVNLRLEQFPEIGDLATEAGGKDLQDKVAKHRATVVILDTISKFSQVGQAVQSDRWQKMYNQSFEPLLKDGISIGQLDHTGLGDKTRERDSNAKRDNVSVAWALTWRGKDRLTLTRAKNRPNYPSPGSVAVERVDEPILTHVFGDSVPDDIRKALEELDRLGVPARAGRPTARAALDAAGVSMADKVLEQAIRSRKQA